MPTHSMKTRKLSTPSEVSEVFTLAGVDYFINWRALAVGRSFFLPTTITAKEITKALKPVTQALGIELQVYSRVEYGRYGARVWRIN